MNAGAAKASGGSLHRTRVALDGSGRMVYGVNSVDTRYNTRCCAAGELLCFVHADSRPPLALVRIMRLTLADPTTVLAGERVFRMGLLAVLVLLSRPGKLARSLSCSY
jgi:hypothetical protein